MFQYKKYAAFRYLFIFPRHQYYRLHMGRYVLIDVAISEHIAPF